ncbi:MAG: 30S ribosome-binding factor RbfA [Treponema sp.]|nr:30S ribosome-binding factor RbfA [Treponema sp.]
MAEYRTERIGHLIQEKISALIMEGRIKDPRVNSFLSVTRVEVSGDLSFADVYVSNIEGSAGRKQGTAGLNSAAGFIQSSLNLKLRKTPRLRFHEDRGISEGFDIVKKIEALSSGKAGDPPPPAGGPDA